MDNEIDKKNRQQTHDWTLIGSGANGYGYGIYIIITATFKPFTDRLSRPENDVCVSLK